MSLHFRGGQRLETRHHDQTGKKTKKSNMFLSISVKIWGMLFKPTFLVFIGYMETNLTFIPGDSVTDLKYFLSPLTRILYIIA